MYSIVEYDERYRPYDKSGGELRQPEWVKMPAKPKGDGLQTLFEYPRGLEIFGIWCLLLQKATKEKRPENRGKLLNHREQPATVSEIAKGISLPTKTKLVDNALNALVEMGWVKHEGKKEITSEELPPTSAKSRVLKSRVLKSICPDLFDRFWKPYPRKDAKQRALKWFKNNQPTESDVGKMVFTIGRQKKKGQRLCCERQFMPLPATWLNDGDWQDAPTQKDLEKQAEEKVAAERKVIEKKRQEIRNEYSKYYQSHTTKQLQEMSKSNTLITHRWLIKEIIAKRKGSD